MDDQDIPDLPPTLAELPFFAAGRYQKPDLVGRCRAGGLETMSGRQLVERVRDLGLGLTAIGLEAGSRVALLAESRPEWLVVDFAILSCGAVTVPIYPTLSTEQVAFILRDSEARLVVVSTADQLHKVAAALAGGPSAIRAVVVMDGAAALPEAAGVPIVSLDEVASRGHRRILDGWGVGREFQDAAKRVRPGDVATIIYTSGTTGPPKGVMLTHGNLVANIAGVKGVLHLDEEDTALSFLPLCHAFERLVACVYLASGVSMIFAESFETVDRDLRLVRPTVMTGVPRMFEKIQTRVLEKGRAAGGVSRRLFDWSVAVAMRRGAVRAGEARMSGWLAWQSRWADRHVFGRVRESVGGRLRFAVSGSAPLRPDIGRFFLGMGVPILEGYGLTETAPVLCVMPLERIRFGTVGPPLPDVQIRIAADGEILARGPNVMAGYHGRPRETAEAIRDGWFHTGDIGSVDPDGYVRITDRKKELLVTSGGKKIAPQPIEEALRAHALVAEAVVICDGRHFPSALVVPDFAELSRALGAGEPRDAAAARALLARDEVRGWIQAIVDEINAGLAQFERIKRFTLLAETFTVAGGELTPTLKVKRRVIEERYRAEIVAMYKAPTSDGRA
jgi:long-chain acyl-CoA synthetase